MSKKKIKFNEETKIIEVIEEETEVKEVNEEETQVVQPKCRRDMANFVISLLTLIIGVVTLGISYSQKVTNEKQVDISERQFDLEKKPVFECHVEREDLYNDEKYWEIYSRWLYENEIRTFNEWYHEMSPENEISHINNERSFWDAYDDHDYEVLEVLTNGKFANLQNQYREYLFSSNYVSFNDWKICYDYEKRYITLNNTGGYISGGRLHVYTFLTYYFEIEDYDTYSFAINMNNNIVSEFWNGTYFTNSAYDSGNNAFYIEYIQDIQVNNEENLKLEDLEDFIGGDNMDDDIFNEIGLDADNIDVFIVMDYSVYFALDYLDIEQRRHTDWYIYDRWGNTLYEVKTSNSSVQVPDFAKEAFTDAYYETETLYIAETLGYDNAQWRPFYELDGDYLYIEKAKEKMISDLMILVNDI